MSEIVYILLAILAVIMFVSMIHLVFTSGRIYECVVAIRELDDKIDTIISKGGGRNDISV